MTSLDIRQIDASLRSPLWDAIGAARDGGVTWLTDNGRRIAAIVPASIAEAVTGEED